MRRGDPGSGSALPRFTPFLFPRDLEARAQSELFRAVFRLPRRERLHTVRDCALWTPFSRRHTAGRLFTSDSYICFASREEGCCQVILPLREVGLQGWRRGKRAWPDISHWAVALTVVAMAT